MRKWNDEIVRTVTRGKTTAKGKSATLAMRQVRANKYGGEMGAVSLTRSGHVRTIREVR